MAMVQGIRSFGALFAAGILVLSVTGCSVTAPASTDSSIDAPVVSDHSIESFLLTSNEADPWVVTPDNGPVGGDTADCTGAPYNWPNLPVVDHASQFLDRQDESMAVLVKRVDGDAALNVDAVRGALAPCIPDADEVVHGAMLVPVGDDSLAYQSAGADDLGEFTTSHMLMACGDLILEVLSRSYSGQLDQGELETLLAPAWSRIKDAGACEG